VITFVVPGKPQPLQRARVGRIGAHARMYDTEANTTNKATVGFHASCAMKGKPLLQGPLRLNVCFYIEKPKSKVRKNSNPFPYPDSKPDLDNCIKLVCDALNGVVWKDDAQVVRLEASKRWINGNVGAPSTVVWIDHISEDF
jgi:Holliday junction resolvase RusA-like endonuclease